MEYAQGETLGTFFQVSSLFFSVFYMIDLEYNKSIAPLPLCLKDVRP